MDMQDFLAQSIRGMRKETFDKSDQLALGEMILKLEPIIEKQKQRIARGDAEATVRYDFGCLFPTDIDSWRGSYDELALNYVGEGEELTATKFFELLKNAFGKKFTGYKGGEFFMNKNTPVWVANYGNSGNTAVIEIIDNDYEIIIITAYRKF
jgi:hypothetical protein